MPAFSSVSNFPPPARCGVTGNSLSAASLRTLLGAQPVREMLAGTAKKQRPLRSAQPAPELLPHQLRSTVWIPTPAAVDIAALLRHAARKEAPGSQPVAKRRAVTQEKKATQPTPDSSNQTPDAKIGQSVRDDTTAFLRALRTVPLTERGQLAPSQILESVAAARTESGAVAARAKWAAKPPVGPLLPVAMPRRCTALSRYVQQTVPPSVVTESAKVVARHAVPIDREVDLTLYPLSCIAGGDRLKAALDAQRPHLPNAHFLYHRRQWHVLSMEAAAASIPSLGDDGDNDDSAPTEPKGECTLVASILKKPGASATAAIVSALDHLAADPRASLGSLADRVSTSVGRAQVMLGEAYHPKARVEPKFKRTLGGQLVAVPEAPEATSPEDAIAALSGNRYWVVRQKLPLAVETSPGTAVKLRYLAPSSIVPVDAVQEMLRAASSVSPEVASAVADTFNIDGRTCSLDVVDDRSSETTSTSEGTEPLNPTGNAAVGVAARNSLDHRGTWGVGWVRGPVHPYWAVSGRRLDLPPSTEATLHRAYPNPAWFTPQDLAPLGLTPLVTDAGDTTPLLDLTVRRFITCYPLHRALFGADAVDAALSLPFNTARSGGPRSLATTRTGVGLSQRSPGGEKPRLRARTFMTAAELVQQRAVHVLERDMTWSLAAFGPFDGVPGLYVSADAVEALGLDIGDAPTIPGDAENSATNASGKASYGSLAAEAMAAAGSTAHRPTVLGVLQRVRGYNAAQLDGGW